MERTGLEQQAQQKFGDHTTTNGAASAEHQNAIQRALAGPATLIDSPIHIMAKERVIKALVEFYRSYSCEKQERDEVMVKEKERERKDKDGIKSHTIHRAQPALRTQSAPASQLVCHAMKSPSPSPSAASSLTTLLRIHFSFDACCSWLSLDGSAGISIRSAHAHARP